MGPVGLLIVTSPLLFVFSLFIRVPRFSLASSKGPTDAQQQHKQPRARVIKLLTKHDHKEQGKKQRKKGSWSPLFLFTK
jgi:hypothetical protein